MRRTCGGLLASVTLFAAIGGCATEAGQDHLKWSVTPLEGTIAIGGQANFTIHVTSKANINSDLELRASPVPSGLEVNLPASATSTASVIEGSFHATPGMEPGLYRIDINLREEGTEYGLPYSYELTVTDGGTAPDFSVEVDPASTTMPVETGKTFAFRVSPLNGFSGTVNISLPDLPNEIRLSQGPTPASLTFALNEGSKGGTFVLQYLPSPPDPATLELVLRAASGAIIHTRTITLTLPAF